MLGHQLRLGSGRWAAEEPSQLLGARPELHPTLRSPARLLGFEFRERLGGLRVALVGSLRERLEPSLFSGPA